MSTPRKVHPIDVFLSFEIRKKLLKDIVPTVRKWHRIIKSEDKKRDGFRAHHSQDVQKTAYMPLENADFDHWEEMARTAAFLCNHTIHPKDVGDKDTLARYIHSKKMPNQDFDEVRNLVQIAFDTRKDCTKIFEELRTMIGEAKLIKEKYHDLSSQVGWRGRKPNEEEKATLKMTPELKEAIGID